MKGFLETLRDFGRPIAVGAMLFLLLIGAVISGVLELFWPGMGIKFTVGVAGWFRAIPPEYYVLAGGAFGVYTGSRGYEKAARSKYGVPGRPAARHPSRPLPRHSAPHGRIRPDDPDGDC